MLVFTDGNNFQIPCQYSSLKTQIKVSMKGSLELDVSWTSWWSSDNHVTPHWAWAWILSARSGCTVAGTPVCLWAGLSSLHQECFLSSEQSLNACYVLSRLALSCIFFIAQIVFTKLSLQRTKQGCTPREKQRVLGDLEGAPLAMFPLEALDFIVFTPHQRKWENISIFHRRSSFLKEMFSVFIRLLIKSVIMENFNHTSQWIRIIIA